MRNPLGRHIVFVAVLWTVACGAGQEPAVLNEFFQAARLHDLTALRSFSFADFPPNVHGIVTDYEIVSMSDERTTEIPAGAFASSPVVELSLEPPVSADQSGAIGEKELLVEVTLERQGNVERQHFAIVLQRALARDRAGRWIVMSVQRRAR